MALDIPGFDDLVEIGRGGFGVVYRANQTALGRTVAVKVLAVGDVDPDSLRRFEREGRILGQLSEHPNIVTVHDSGTTADGRPWVAMAYLPNGSLGDRLRAGGPLPPDEVASIGIRIAGALETAHRAGIFHRDVKPENILLTSYGEPSLADFGIARMVGGTQTVAGAVTASLTHAAPEVLEGAPPGPAGDVYSLASTLFALVNGRAAFDPGPDGAVSQLIAGIVSRPVPDLRLIGVPEPLAAAIELGLSKDVEERPATASDFADLLRQAQRDAGWPVTDPVVLDTGIDALDTTSFGVASRGDVTADEDVTRVHSVTGGAGGDTATRPDRATPLDDGAKTPTTRPDGGGTPGAGTDAETDEQEAGGRQAPGGGGPGRWPLIIGVTAAAVVGAVVLMAVTGGDDGVSPDSSASASDDTGAGDDPGSEVNAGDVVFVDGPNSGEGRVIFRQELDATPLAITTDGEGLYLATETSIEGRTLEDGLVRWSVARPTPGVEPLDLFVADGRLLFTDGDDVVALDVTSGVEVGRLQLDGAPTSVHVTEQGVVLVAAGPTVARVDANGDIAWRVEKPLAEGERYRVHPHLEDEPIIVTTDLEMLGVDASTGEALWTVTLPPHDEGSAVQVAQGNGSVFTAAVEAGRLTVRANVAASGDVLWDVNRGEVDADGVVMAIEDGIVVIADGLRLTALDGNSGNPDWQVDLATGDDLSLITDTGRVWTVGDFDDGPRAGVYSVYSGDIACGPTDLGSFPEWPATAGGRWIWADTAGTIVGVDVPDGSDAAPYGGDCTLAWAYDLPLDANAVATPLYADSLGHLYVIDDSWGLTGLRLWDQ